MNLNLNLILPADPDAVVDTTPTPETPSEETITTTTTPYTMKRGIDGSYEIRDSTGQPVEFAPNYKDGVILLHALVFEHDNPLWMRVIDRIWGHLWPDKRHVDAAHLAAKGSVTDCGDGDYEVQSQDKYRVYPYTVHIQSDQEWSCTCAYFSTHPSEPCKHILSAHLHKRYHEEWEVKPDRVLRDARTLLLGKRRPMD